MKYFLILASIVALSGCVGLNKKEKKESIEAIDQSSWFSSGLEGEKLEPMEQCLTDRVKLDGMWTIKAELECTKRVENSKRSQRRK